MYDLTSIQLVFENDFETDMLESAYYMRDTNTISLDPKREVRYVALKRGP